MSLLVVVFATNSIFNQRKKNKSKMSFRESMDLTSLAVVTFLNDGKKLNFLLDTGSDNSIINEAILDDVWYELSDKVIDVHGMEGNPLECKHCIMELTYKDIKFNIEPSIVDLSDIVGTIKQTSGVSIHGILGSNFMREYKYILDFVTLEAYIK